MIGQLLGAFLPLVGYNYDQQSSSISDWMVLSSVPIVAGTENVGSLFNGDSNSTEISSENQIL